MIGEGHRECEGWWGRDIGSVRGRRRRGDKKAMGDIEYATMSTKLTRDQKAVLTADSSSLYIFIVLSASAVSSRQPLMSKQQVKMPASLSREPGCTCV